MFIYKVYHKDSHLFYKGGGMKLGTMVGFTNPTTKEWVRYSGKNRDHALKICFSKKGKLWQEKHHVKAAISAPHEPALIELLKECTIQEIAVGTGHTSSYSYQEFLEQYKK